MALKPHLLAFDTNYRPLLSSAQALLSLGWNGDATALKAQGVPIEYVVPTEGSQIWEDDWAIAAVSSHPEIAHDFLNFVLRPEVAAREALYTRYATGNQSALALLDGSIRTDRSTYPPKGVIEKLEAGLPLDPGEKRMREQLWQEIRET